MPHSAQKRNPHGIFHFFYIFHQHHIWASYIYIYIYIAGGNFNDLLKWIIHDSWDFQVFWVFRDFSRLPPTPLQWEVYITLYHAQCKFASVIMTDLYKNTIFVIIYLLNEISILHKPTYDTPQQNNQSANIMHGSWDIPSCLWCKKFANMV